jgi:hypothetical protein
VFESGLDIAPNSKLLPRFPESTQSRLFPLSMSSRAAREEPIREEIYRRGAGLDVHQESVEPVCDGSMRTADGSSRRAPGAR